MGDSNAIAELLISLDGNNWQNVKSQLVNNVVTIDRVKLETLFGKMLVDGSYTISVRSKDNVGKLTNQSLSFDLDRTAPTLDVSGVFNGINWLPSDQVKAQLTDRGSGLLNVTYQVDNQGPIAWTGSNGNWFKSVGELLNWNDSQQQGSHQLTVRGTDRAGNEQSQTIDFAVAKPLTWIDTDVWSDTPLNPSNPNSNDSFTGAPAGGGSGSGSVVYGWGTNGYWGYGSGGSWFVSPYNTPQGVMSNPQWFPGNPNPTDVSTYRQRLTKILTTAIAAIPGTTDANKSKKAALKNRMAVLIESGVIIHGDSSENTSWGYEGGGFPGDSYWNDRFFLGSLEKASHSNVSTVSLGLALAKDIMNGTDSVRLQTFETLVETVIGAAHLDTNWFGSGKMVEIQRSAREIARLYGLLKPQGTALAGTFAWLDQLWDLAESPNLSGTAIRSLLFDRYDNTKGIVGKVIQMMNGLGNDYSDRNDAQLLGMAEGLLRSALQVDALKSDLQSVEVVQELLQLGYEIVKVNPTTTADNATEVSTWIETILEKGDERSAAAGLSEFIGGSKSRGDRIRTLQFSGRLMRAAEGVLDWRAKLQIQRSDTLSELVNLGGAYAGLNPNEGTPLDADPNKMFLKTLWGEFLHQRAFSWASEQLESIVLAFNDPSSLNEAIQYERNVFKQIKDVRLGRNISVLNTPSRVQEILIAEENSIDSGWSILNQGNPSNLLIASAGSNITISQNIQALPWEPPGNQPNLYIGNTAHREISDYYRRMRPSDERELIYTNYKSVGVILEDLGRRGFRTSFRNISSQEANSQPDIANIVAKQLYEIKSRAGEAQGAKEVGEYRTALRKGGVDINFGPVHEAAARGIVPAPGGHFVFAPSQTGVIIYRRFNGDYNQEATERKTGLTGWDLLWALLLGGALSQQKPTGNPKYGY